MPLSSGRSPRSSTYWHGGHTAFVVVGLRAVHGRALWRLYRLPFRGPQVTFPPSQRYWSIVPLKRTPVLRHMQRHWDAKPLKDPLANCLSAGSLPCNLGAFTCLLIGPQLSQDSAVPSAGMAARIIGGTDCAPLGVLWSDKCVATRRYGRPFWVAARLGPQGRMGLWAPRDCATLRGCIHLA